MTSTTTALQKSTTVRAASPQLRWISRAMAVAQRVAPALAHPWAARLWCTLPSGRSRLLDRRPSPGEPASIPLAGGRSISAESWGAADAPPVYLVHGWGGQRGQLGAFVTPLVDAGFRVIAYDAPSHGDSDPGVLGPRRSTALEFADALRAVARRFGPPAGVVAHSLGAVAVSTAMTDGLAVGRIVFVAPTGDLDSLFTGFTRALGLSPATRDGMIGRLERMVGRPMSDFDVLVEVPGPRPPALIVHDRQDREVDYDDALRLVDGWPESELVTTEGLGHHRLLGDAVVVDAVAEYLARR